MSCAPSWPAGVDPGASIVLFDGVCKLCNAGVNFIIAHDSDARLRLASVQSLPGQALLSWSGLPVDQFDTMVFIENGRAYVKSTAILRIARRLRWPWRLLSLFMTIPRELRDWLYDRIAGNRYRMFGKRETCLMPMADVRRRFLDG